MKPGQKEDKTYQHCLGNVTPGMFVRDEHIVTFLKERGDVRRDFHQS
jgi:hypothetical protein